VRLPGLLLLGVLACAALPARAQLLSPGPLVRAHADLEGIRNCTQCHALGNRGIDPARCLTCHTPLRDRIRRNEGLHARLSQDCATCHSDHHGRAFEPAAFTESRFNHRLTGYDLVGEHATTACRSCHQPANITDPAVRRTIGPTGRLAQTYLGLGTSCETCHARETPHTPALAGQTCQSCHSPEGWDETPRFSHRATGFALTGGHVRASCSGCHAGSGAARFRDVPQRCESCHQADSPHGRQFQGQTCASCHTTATWASAPGFNHSRTAFPLTGSHARVDCASCHTGGRFEGTAAQCASCHATDSPHGTQFQGQECGACHGPSRWDGAELFRHDRTDFPLTGRHVQTDCASCHPGEGRAQRFTGIEHGTCQSCHEDTHEGALGADCATCHATAGWDRMASTFAADRFDHEAHTGFALVGAHGAADCASCHGTGARADGVARRDAGFDIRLAGPASGASFPAVLAERDGRACLSCHTDAHEGALADLPGGADCQSCHAQDAWTPVSFDLVRHDETPFALTGAHLAVPCSACHGDGPRPDFAVGAACQSCHADASPHGAQFAGDDGATACADCHATTSWVAAAFDHDARTGFALTGAHAAETCASCHTRPDAGSAEWSFAGLDATCQSCHAADDPHAGQFEGRTCDTCHATDAFTLAAFDHTATAFPLTGAHEGVTCASCHATETAPGGRAVVRFRPLRTDCAGCHATADG
jgi:hypothetical protein